MKRKFGTISWYMLGIVFETRSLERYLDTVTSSLVTERKELDDRLREEAASLDEESASYLYDHYSDLAHGLEDAFPRLFVHSYFVTLTSFVEHELKTVCGRIERKTPGAPAFRGKPGILVSAAAYIRSPGGVRFPDTRQWKAILRYYRIRNALVHNAGEVKATDRDLVRYLRRKKCLKGDLRFRKPQLTIDLTPSFCHEALETVRQFFRQLDGRTPSALKVDW